MSLLCLKQNDFPLLKEKLTIELSELSKLAIHEIQESIINDSLGFLWKEFCFE